MIYVDLFLVAYKACMIICIDICAIETKKLLSLLVSPDLISELYLMMFTIIPKLILVRSGLNLLPGGNITLL